MKDRIMKLLKSKLFIYIQWIVFLIPFSIYEYVVFIVGPANTLIDDICFPISIILLATIIGRRSICDLYDYTEIRQKQRQTFDKIRDLIKSMSQMESIIMKLDKDNYITPCVDLNAETPGLYLYSSKNNEISITLPRFKIAFHQIDGSVEIYYRESIECDYEKLHAEVLEQLKKAEVLYSNHFNRLLYYDIIPRYYPTLKDALDRGQKAGLLATIYHIETTNHDSPYCFMLRVENNNYKCNDFSEEAINWFVGMVDEELKNGTFNKAEWVN